MWLVPGPCHRQARLCALCLALACALSLGSGASLASASKGLIGTFGSTGREPGQFEAPRGVAVNDSTGDLYVVDSTEDRVEVFDANGDYLSRFEYLSLAESEGVAIDQSTGTVYVTARDPSRIDVFNAAGVFEGSFGSEGSGAGELGAEVGYLAVNPTNGDVVLADASNRRIDEFSVTVTLGVVTATFVRAIGWGGISNADDELQVCTTATGCVAGLEGDGAGEFGTAGPTRVAVDSSGVIYAVDPSNSRVEKFAADGSSAETFAAAQLSGTPGPGDVAVEPGTDDVYVTKPVANTVSGELEQQVFELDVAGTPIGAPDGVGAKIPSDNGLAVGSFNGDIYLTSEAPDNHVTALNTIDPTSVGAMDVKDTSATLQAQINPGGSDTRYRFEYDTSPYDTSAAHGTSVPAPDGDAGTGSGLVPVSTHLQNLQPDTTYHFRVVATNASHEVTYSPDHTFTTQVASEFALLDGRAWEMVSPPDKHGATIEALTQEGGVIQASEDGGAITYVTHGPIGAEEPKGNPAFGWTQILSTRGPEGDWVTQDIATPHETPILETPIGDPTEYKFFSADLSLGLVEPLVNPAISESTVYLREADGEYKPLVTSANVPSGTEFANKVHVAGATPDLSNVVLGSPVALTSTPAPEGGLYEWAAGQQQLVSVLPGPGEQPAKGPQLGGDGDAGQDVRHAISNNGTRIVWAGGQGREEHLYMRDMARGETVEVDGLQGGSNSGSALLGPVFQTASSNGSKVFFTDEQPLTQGSTATYENPDLYVFEVSSSSGEPLAGRLTDLTVDPNLDEDANVQGTLPGASEGENESESYVYFIAHGVLGSGENGQHETAMAGGNNLYVRHNNGGEWQEPTFIAMLSNEDSPDWKEQLPYMTSRVSPNGRYLAFMSDRPLTGYDNVDANSGMPDEEVFLYDATSGRLACASCEPTGAKPMGVFDTPVYPGLLVDRRGVWAGSWLAGSIPSWTAVNDNLAFYQSRYLFEQRPIVLRQPGRARARGCEWQRGCLRV